MVRIIFLIFLSTPLLAQKNIDRADFYINTNECINCQIFLPNYAIALQNSDTLNLYLDIKSERFATKYLSSKGIDVAKFDSVYYDDLLGRHNGFFESYIVISKNGKTDTVYVKEPLVFENTASVSESSDSLACDETTDRITTYYSRNSFLILDYLLEKTYKYETENDKVIKCSDNSFKVEENTEIYKDFIINHGFSLELTQAMEYLLIQLGRDKSKSISVSQVNLDDDFTCMVAHPYVYRVANGDTALSTISLVQNSKSKILGIFKQGTELYESTPQFKNNQYSIFNMYIYDDGKLITQVKINGENYKEGDKFLGYYELNNDGFFNFQSELNFTLPPEINSGSLSLRFATDLIHFKNAPYFYDLIDSSRTKINLPLTEDSQFKLFLVSRVASDPNSFRIIYSIDNMLYISQFNKKLNKNSVLAQRGIRKDQFAIPQKDFVFLFTIGGPSLPFEVMAYPK